MGEGRAETVRQRGLRGEGAREWRMENGRLRTERGSGNGVEREEGK